MTYVVVFVVAAAVTVGFTAAVRRYALAREIIDRPNTRSSHNRPVPRGGGVAIVATVLVGVLLLAALGAAPWGLTLALAGGGALVGTIGWLDDRRGGLSPVARALVHAAAAVWGLAWLGGLDRLSLGAAHLELGAMGSIVAAVGIIWSINLHNFMDGIDGIAAGQAVTVACFAAALTLLHYGDGVVRSALLLGGAAAGFLVWNWAPARIFMGDVGSGFIGYVIAVLAIASERAGSLPLLAWVILSGAFLFDSTATLLRRVIRGERWYAAHRSHAYQRLVVAGFSHDKVTSAVLLLNAVLAVIVAIAVSGVATLLAAAVAALLLLSACYLLVERAAPMERPPLESSRPSTPRV
jgi:Fuc2NAc and GlcNAc transferase